MMEKRVFFTIFGTCQEDLAPEGQASQLLLQLRTVPGLAEEKVAPLMDQAEPAKVVRLLQGIPAHRLRWWEFQADFPHFPCLFHVLPCLFIGFPWLFPLLSRFSLPRRKLRP